MFSMEIILLVLHGFYFTAIPEMGMFYKGRCFGLDDRPRLIADLEQRGRRNLPRDRCSST
jgi:hypothetical protein